LNILRRLAPDVVQSGSTSRRFVWKMMQYRIMSRQYIAISL
jgi:hypothetical protein